MKTSKEFFEKLQSDEAFAKEVGEKVKAEAEAGQGCCGNMRGSPFIFTECGFSADGFYSTMLLLRYLSNMRSNSAILSHWFISLRIEAAPGSPAT